MGHGLCHVCYSVEYRGNPAKQARIKKVKSKWYRKVFTPDKLKEKREQEHFGGNREAALKRDGYRCVRCPSTTKLTVHHIDRTGRGVKGEDRNNDLSNLETLCRKCHIAEHRTELVTAAREFYRK